MAGRNPIFLHLENAKLKNLSGIAIRRRLGRVRMEWRDGTHCDLTPLSARRLARIFDDFSAAAVKREAITKINFVPSPPAAVEVILDGDYHGEKMPVIRLHWGDGTYLDIHASMGREYAAALRSFADF